MKPCCDCPWVSGQLRDIQATTAPDMKAAMERGDQFVCHKHCGPCIGAKLKHDQFKKEEGQAGNVLVR